MDKTQAKLYLLWFLVVASFIAGILLPIATVEKFLISRNTFSLIGSLVELFGNLDNLLIFLIILLFTILFPLAKIITMFMQIKNQGKNWQNRATKILETIGHFSMVDVFVIALMVLLLKLRVLVNVEVEVGFYLFTLSIVLSIILSFTLKALREKETL